MKKSEFLIIIENFLERTGFSAAGLGKAAANDTRLVFMLRNGRECREKTQEKVLAWIAQHEKDNQINLTDETGK